RELAQRFGGLTQDPELVPEIPREPVEPIVPDPAPGPEERLVEAAGWPFDAEEAGRRQQAEGAWEKIVELGEGVTLKLVRIPAGEFVMGSTGGEVDEYPVARVSIARPFWMSACEITNEQFRRFDPSHEPGVFSKRSLDVNGPGIALDGPRQPVVRVSWQQAMEFCRWLSEEAGVRFVLPTEAQWEYACRAGSSTDLFFGALGADFSGRANLADKTLSQIHTHTGGLVVLQEIPSDAGFDDGALVTADVAGYRPNAWGLYDMHGNAAEWTLSGYEPYPYQDDQRNSPTLSGRRVVRGGSFYDRAKRSRSAFRLSYPAWQRVHNVGFRVVCEAGGRVAAR
ncbi:MAG: formylglycine-generating enzyme family protein, partial [Planctomycetota bacterium]